MLGEEVRVTRGDDTVAREQTGVPMIGVEPVALPRIVAEHDLGSELADHPRDHGHAPTRSLSSSPST